MNSRFSLVLLIAVAAFSILARADQEEAVGVTTLKLEPVQEISPLRAVRKEIESIDREYMQLDRVQTMAQTQTMVQRTLKLAGVGPVGAFEAYQAAIELRQSDLQSQRSQLQADAQSSR
ncbi:MAG: hypothetical protein AB7K41_16390 [Bdellovibrionales bacterium]